MCVSPTTALRKSVAEKNRGRRDPVAVRVGGKTSVRRDVGQLWRVHVGMSSPWSRCRRYLRFRCLGSYRLRVGAHKSVHGAHRPLFFSPALVLLLSVVRMRQLRQRPKEKEGVLNSFYIIEERLHAKLPDEVTW